MTEQEERHDPLWQVVDDAGEHAEYLAEIDGGIADVYVHLEKLRSLMRKRLRGESVEGDRWFDPWLRSRPTDKAYRDLLKTLSNTRKALEKCTETREGFDVVVRTTRRERWHKKHGKRPVALPPTYSLSPQESGVPESILDIADEEPA